MSERFGAYLELTLAMIIVGSSIVVGKIAVASFPVFTASALRFGIASAILLPLLLKIEGGIPSITKKDWLVLFLQAFTGVFLFSVFLLYGLKLTTAAESGIITSTTPAMVAVLSFFFIKERFTWNIAAGIAFATLGVLAMNITGISSTNTHSATTLLGNVLVLGAVVGEALFTIFRKLVSAKVTSLMSATFVSLFGFFTFLPFCIGEVRTFDISKVHIEGWIAILYYGIVVTVIAFVLWFRGVSKVPANVAAVFTGILPISAVLLSYIILKEAFLWSHLIGIACVLLGVGFITQGFPNRKKLGM